MNGNARNPFVDGNFTWAFIGLVLGAETRVYAIALAQRKPSDEHSDG